MSNVRRLCGWIGEKPKPKKKNRDRRHAQTHSYIFIGTHTHTPHTHRRSAPSNDRRADLLAQHIRSVANALTQIMRDGSGTECARIVWVILSDGLMGVFVSVWPRRFVWELIVSVCVCLRMKNDINPNSVRRRFMGSKSRRHQVRTVFGENNTLVHTHTIRT